MANKLVNSSRKRPTTPRRAIRKRSQQDEPEYISRHEGSALLDRQARKYLQMSGEEFRTRYAAGNLSGLDPDAVRRVSLLLPMSND